MNQFLATRNGILATAVAIVAIAFGTGYWTGCSRTNPRGMLPVNAESTVTEDKVVEKSKEVEKRYLEAKPAPATPAKVDNVTSKLKGVPGPVSADLSVFN